MIHYNKTAIERTRAWLVEKAMKPSTSTRLSGHLFEAAETITQLRKELEKAEAETKETCERLARFEGEEAQRLIDDDKFLSKLEDTFSEIWKQKAKLYDVRREDYIRGQMNVILSIQKAIAEIRKKNESPKDLWEWVKKFQEEFENET